jgi:hypothetical protein
MNKIYSDDPNLPYKTTKLNALYTKAEIDGLFAKWQIKDVYWHYDPEHNDVFAQFKIVEVVEGLAIDVAAKVEAPIIWEHKTRNKAETVNWNISMRVLFWFLKTHLEAAYLRQSSKTAAFLPYIMASDGQTTLKDILIPRLQQLEKFKALPEAHVEENKIIEA